MQYADVPPGGTVVVHGLGPIGQMCCRIARHLGAGLVIGVDKVPERLAMAQRWGVTTIDFSEQSDVVQAVKDLTSGRGADSSIDAVGMEADGSLADSVLATVKVQTDRLKALHTTMSTVRRGGTVSVSGVYTGAMPLFPLGDLFDKQIALHWGQANVKRWVDDILPLLTAADPLGTADLVTHRMPLVKAAEGYRIFQEKADDCIKVVLDPAAG